MDGGMGGCGVSSVFVCWSVLCVESGIRIVHVSVGRSVCLSGAEYVVEKRKVKKKGKNAGTGLISLLRFGEWGVEREGEANKGQAVLQADYKKVWMKGSYFSIQDFSKKKW